MAASYAEIYRGLRRVSSKRGSSRDEEYVSHAA
jgi:hypothetical protein